MPRTPRKKENKKPVIIEDVKEPEPEPEVEPETETEQAPEPEPEDEEIELVMPKSLYQQTAITTSMIRLNRASCKMMKKQYMIKKSNSTCTVFNKVAFMQELFLIMGWSARGNSV